MKRHEGPSPRTCSVTQSTRPFFTKCEFQRTLSLKLSITCSLSTSRKVFSQRQWSGVLCCTRHAVEATLQLDSFITH